MPTSEPSSARSRNGASRPRLPAGGRLDLLAALEMQRRLRLRSAATLRDSVQTRRRSAGAARQRRGPVGGRAARSRRASVRPPAGTGRWRARQGAEVCAAAEPLPEVAGQRADVRAGAAFHLETAVGRSGSLRPTPRARAADRDRVRRQLRRRPLPGQLVGAPSADLERAVGRRPLLDYGRGSRPGPPRRPRASGAGPLPGTSSPSRSSVSDVAPKQTVAR
jgi:hypothetical protein